MAESRPKPSVSVVIPTRDRPAELARAISAALLQRDVDLEVLVIDDGSAVPAESGSDPRVRLLRRSEPGGVARARNDGIAAADGDWIAFLDDDDIWAPDRLRKLLDAAERQDADAVIGVTLAIDDRGRPLQVDPVPDVARLGAELRSANVLGGPSGVMVHRRLLAVTGGFDPAFSVLADWELYLRLADHGTFGLCPEILNGYVIHSAGMHVRQTAAALDEFQRLAEIYGRADDPDGDGMYDEYFMRWAASAHRRAGRRVAASRLYLRNYRRHRAGSDLVRAAVSVVSERAMRRLGQSRRPPTPVPPAWLALYVTPHGLQPAPREVSAATL